MVTEEAEGSRMPGVPLKKLLFSTGPLFRFGLEEALGIIAEAGFEGAELMVSRDPATWEPERVRRAAESTGVAVRAVHGPFLLVTRNVFGKLPAGKAERTVALARAVGADVVVLHPPYRWQASYLEGLEALRREGPTITVENMFPVTLGSWGVWFHRWATLEDLAAVAPLTLDTSHLAVAGLDPEAAAGALAGKVAHVHLSNNLGNGRDSHAPLDMGVLDLGRFVKVLLEQGYSGYLTLEVDCSAHLSNREGLVRFLTYMRSVAGEILRTAGAR
jgi:sugar phosphate isomerase/epimerase